MKTTAVAAVAALAAIAVACAGCESTGRGEQAAAIENIALLMGPGKSFPATVSVAASRCKLMPKTLPGGTVRCTSVRSGDRVIVDVIPGDGVFSIRLVESDVSVREYNAMVDGLRREIEKEAAK